MCCNSWGCKESDTTQRLNWTELNWHSQRLWLYWRLVNKAEVDILEFSCFFYHPMDVGNLISGSSVFPKSTLNIWKSTVHVLLKPGLENFEYYFAGVWDKCNCAVVWAFFGTAPLWDWNTFSSPVANQFSKFAGILSAALLQHHSLGLEVAQLKSYHRH